MSSKFLCLAVISVLAAGHVAQADDKLMNLYPTSRAKYVEKSEYNAAKYKTRGQQYVDHQYDTGGETPMPEDQDVELESEDDTVPVDVNAVANIVKDSASVSEKDIQTKP
jgi:hypothetical protein